MMRGLKNLVLLNVEAVSSLPLPLNGTLLKNSTVIHLLIDGCSFIQEIFVEWVLCQALFKARGTPNEK